MRKGNLCGNKEVKVARFPARERTRDDGQRYEAAFNGHSFHASLRPI